MISVLDDVWDGNSKSNSDLHHVGKCVSRVQQTRISENLRIPALHRAQHWYGATSALALLGMVGQGKIDKWKGRMVKSKRIEKFVLLSFVSVFGRMWWRSGNEASSLRRCQRVVLQSQREAGNGKGMLRKRNELR